MNIQELIEQQCRVVSRLQNVLLIGEDSPEKMTINSGASQFTCHADNHQRLSVEINNLAVLVELSKNIFPKFLTEVKGEIELPPCP